MKRVATRLPMLLALLALPGAHGAPQAGEADESPAAQEAVAREPAMLVLDAPVPKPPVAGITEAMIKQAVRETIAEDPRPLPVSARGAISGGPSAQAHTSAAFDAARVPDCLHADALKHQPATLGPINVGGIYSLPWVIAAAVRGKCN